MSEAYRAGKWHAESDHPSNLTFYAPRTFAWFDYLEGQRTGFNERVFYASRCLKDEAEAAKYQALLDQVKADLKAAGR